jgi:hypothetical protein
MISPTSARIAVFMKIGCSKKLTAHRLQDSHCKGSRQGQYLYFSKIEKMSLFHFFFIIILKKESRTGRK